MDLRLKIKKLNVNTCMLSFKFFFFFLEFFKLNNGQFFEKIEY
jgi:hypothetical protein